MFEGWVHLLSHGTLYLGSVIVFQNALSLRLPDTSLFAILGTEMTAYARAFIYSLLATSIASVCPIMASGQQEKGRCRNQVSDCPIGCAIIRRKRGARIASVVIEALNQRNIQEATRLMTEKGFEDYCGQQFMFILQLSLVGSKRERTTIRRKLL